jgi:hypothetical protein
MVSKICAYTMKFSRFGANNISGYIKILTNPLCPSFRDLPAGLKRRGGERACPGPPPPPPGGSALVPVSRLWTAPLPPALSPAASSLSCTRQFYRSFWKYDPGYLFRIPHLDFFIFFFHPGSRSATMQKS